MIYREWCVISGFIKIHVCHQKSICKGCYSGSWPNYGQSNLPTRVIESAITMSAASCGTVLIVNKLS